MQMKNWFNKLVKMSLLLVLFLLTACNTTELTERLWTEAPGWSRAQKVSQTNLVDPAAITLDDEGNIYLIVADLEEQTMRPSVVALDRQAETIWEQIIDLDVDRIDNPAILWDGELLRLFWIADNGLHTASVDKSGNVTGGPLLLSGETKVETFAVERRVDGALSVWYAGPRREPGLYNLPVGDLGGRPILVDPLGTRPAIKYDLDGALHASWVQRPPGDSGVRIFYGFYPEGEFAPGLAGEFRNERPSVTSVFLGPYLELDDTSTYIFWSEETRTGQSAGLATSHYSSFPLGRPAQASRPIQIIVPSKRNLEYSYFPEDGLFSGPRALLTPGSFSGASGLRRISSNLALANEGAVASQSRVDYLFNKTATQVGINYFNDGSSNGYQLISFTSRESTSPAIFSDEDDRLYLTWLEREGSEFQVYFASTAEDIKDNLNSITIIDVGQFIGETVFGLLIGGMLAPVALVLWLLIPLAILLVTSPLRRGEQDLRNPGTVISLGLSVLVFLAIKVFSLPGLRSYVPFSAWLPVPSWMQWPLQIIVPLAISITALIIAWTFTYRRRNNSPFYFIILFGVADSFMTMAIYGVLIFNAF
jgi:hypothetical protein